MNHSQAIKEGTPGPLEKNGYCKSGSGLAALIEGFFVRYRERFYYLHILMFVLFALLVAVPPFLPFPEEDTPVFGSFVLFSRFAVWGVWFPLMLLSVILFGRLWCGLLCPQGALSEFAGRRGLTRALPRWLRWEWMPVISFILVTVFGQVVGVRDYPLAALEVLGGTMVLAALTGFAYGNNKRRPWCRYLCPVGALLGIFSRLGGVSFERNCSWVRGSACPTFINTRTKAASSNCIECFRCVDAGDHGSLRLALRRPGREIEEIDRREPDLKEVAFLFMATGLALGAFHWQINPSYITFKQQIGGLLIDLGFGGILGSNGPRWVMVNYPELGEAFNWLDLVSISSFMLLVMAGVSLVLFSLTALSAIVSGKGSVLSGIRRLGYVYAPLSLVSLVLGLGQILFQSIGSFGPEGAVTIIQGTLFAGGFLWSLYLAARLQGFSLSLLPGIAGIAFVALAWQRALF